MTQETIFEKVNLDNVSHSVDISKNTYYNISRVTSLKDDLFFNNEMKEKIKSFLNKKLNPITEDDKVIDNHQMEINKDDNLCKSGTLNIVKKLTDEEFIKKLSKEKREKYNKNFHLKIKLWLNQHKNEIDMIYISAKSIFNKNKIIIPVSDSKLYSYFVQHLYFIYHNLF